MTDNVFKYAELKPHFEAKISKLDSSLAEWKEKFEKDPYNALDWSDGAFETATLRRWMIDVQRLCEEAEEKTGSVDLEEIKTTLRRCLLNSARSMGSTSTSPTRSIMQRFEISTLSKAEDMFGDSILSPFENAVWERRSQENRAKAEAASYRILNKSGKKWRNRANDGWTTKIELAGVWSYSDRPKIDAVAGDKYEMIEEGGK